VQAPRGGCAGGSGLPFDSRRRTMTTISQTAGQTASRKSPTGFFGLLGGWVNRFVTHLAHRQAIKTLNELDDRALRDIGIERGRIESAVRGMIDPTYGRMM
jgi:uncharacterized protein YjiS (DUF1127 family)